MIFGRVSYYLVTKVLSVNELDLTLLLLDNPRPPIGPACVHDGTL